MNLVSSLLSVSHKKPDIPGFFSFYILLAAIILGINGCIVVEEPVYDNPFDPENDAFVLPEAKIDTTGALKPGAVLNYGSVVIYWDGNNQYSTYSFMLRGYSTGYSTWQSVHNAIFAKLDEGTYTFLVKEMYTDDLVQEHPDSLTFTVDAIKDCALILRRWAVNAVAGTTFTIYLDIENVSRFKGLTTVVAFPASYCTLQNISKVNNSMPGVDNILLLTSTVADANASGEAEINIVCLGTENGFTGNGTLCKLEFLSNNDAQYSITVNKDDSELRDVENNKIDLVTVRESDIN